MTEELEIDPVPDSGPLVGFAKGRPSTFSVTQSHHETVHVLEGRASVEVDGRKVSLGPGDATTFYAGRVARWTIVEPLLEFFVMSPIGPG
uniref:cupin domain-containing protein n=1 Tax=Rhodococcus qingshengii TaxID=334542 RepID=UPI001C4DF06E